MKSISFFFFLFFTIFFSPDIFGQPERNRIFTASVYVEKIYLAKDDGGGKPGVEANVFSTTDVPIYCVVLFDSVKPAIIKMNFIAVNVVGVKPETKVISISYKTDGTQDRVNFTGKPEGVWTAGNYRIDIFVDGAAAGYKQFEIRNSLDEIRNLSKPVVENFVFPKPKPAMRIRKIKNKPFRTIIKRRV